MQLWSQVTRSCQTKNVLTHSKVTVINWPWSLLNCEWKYIMLVSLVNLKVWFLLCALTLLIIYFLYILYLSYFQQQVAVPWGVTLNSSIMIGHVSSFVRAVNNKLIYVWILETWLYELLGLVACLVLLTQIRTRRLANI